jgi:hypothetical protein
VDPIIHTIIALGAIFISWKIGRFQSNKDAIERYTQTLEDHGYIYITQLRDGSYEFVKHWKKSEVFAEEEL